MADPSEAGAVVLNASHAHDAVADATAASVDLGVIADSVLRSFAGEVPRERVERLLTELLEQEFSTARVTTFLPIFLHRVACDTLRREAGGRG
jgi:hypothetical protein